MERLPRTPKLIAPIDTSKTFDSERQGQVGDIDEGIYQQENPQRD